MKGLLFVLALLLEAEPAAAGQQGSPSSDAVIDHTPVRRIETAVGGVWLGGASLGVADAAIRGSQTGRSRDRSSSPDRSSALRCSATSKELRPSLRANASLST